MFGKFVTAAREDTDKQIKEKQWEDFNENRRDSSPSESEF